MSTLQDRLSAVRGHWRALAPRERRAVAAMAALLVLALCWWVAIAPAVRVLRAAPAQRALLDGQLQAMHAMQAEAQTLRSQPAIGRDEAQRALESALRQRLGGTAQINVVGGRVTVTLKGAAPEALAQWLAQARMNARALPVEARLTRSTASAQAGAPATWDGTLVLSLPEH